MRAMLIIATLLFSSSLVGAQELKVNDEAWNSLQAEGKADIEAVLSQNFKGQDFVVTPEADVPPPADTEFVRGSFCVPLCEISAITGSIACQGIPGLGATLCLSLVSQAKDACVARCQR